MKTFTVETGRALIQTLRGIKALTHYLLEEQEQLFVLLGKKNQIVSMLIHAIYSVHYKTDDLW